MNTLNLGISMNQGDDFSLTIQISNDEGAPINLTGYQFFGEMKLNTDPEADVEAEFLFSILNQTTNRGQVVWSLANSVTSDLLTSVSDAEQKRRLTTPYLFDVKMKAADNVITRIIQGIMYVSPQVTQEP